jgi:hypothetical protein
MYNNGCFTLSFAKTIPVTASSTEVTNNPQIMVSNIGLLSSSCLVVLGSSIDPLAAEESETYF